MISVRVCLDDYDWEVYAFFASTKYNLDAMTGALAKAECPSSIVGEAVKLVNENRLDTGFTYSNKRRHMSVFVVGLASAPQQYLNSFAHELRHLTDDIADTLGMDANGEPVAYLAGEIAETFYGSFHPLICCQRWGVHSDDDEKKKGGH